MLQKVQENNDPIFLLEKPSYKTIVMKMKAPMLNTLFLPCCYSSENIFKVYKWVSIEPKYNLANG